MISFFLIECMHMFEDVRKSLEIVLSEVCSLQRTRNEFLVIDCV